MVERQAWAHYARHGKLISQPLNRLKCSDLAYRKKQMFTVPVGDWFKGKLKPLCEDLLLSDKARDRKYFNYDYVQKLFEDHCSGDSNNTREIRALMAFEYWCRIFIDCDYS
jgi:asparagine synthase (glutamine-hydrolysing)